MPSQVFWDLGRIDGEAGRASVADAMVRPDGSVDESARADYVHGYEVGAAFARLARADVWSV